MLEKLAAKSFRHWTPRYLFDRLSVTVHQKRYPDHPWLTRTAIPIVESFLRGTDTGLEFGAGRSTLWFASRVGQLVSVEHTLQYYEKVSKRLKEHQIANVDLRHVEQDKPDEQGWDSQYVQVIREFPANWLDFALVDGVYRVQCALEVLDHIKPGGMLILDNSNWFIPSSSRAPASQREPASAEWAEFLRLVRDWRSIWTTNGVWDTTLYIKPCQWQR
jgi:predicted O-methyltransferase YrrM